jgi:hypothetical protein
MVRLLRIICVISIATLLTISLLLVNKIINIFDWITFSKITFSVLLYSLIYLLLDNKRTSLVGKISQISTFIGLSILVLSIFFTSFNVYWNIAFGLFILSFILILFSRISEKNNSLKYFFYSAFNIPLGIILSVENTLFYVFAGIILTLLSVTSIFYQLKK